MKRWRQIAAVAALAAGMAAGADAARAQEKPANGDFDPKVKALLAQVRAAYQGLDALHVKITGTMTTNAVNPLAADFPRAAELRYQKPNRLYVFLAFQKPAGLSRRVIVSDGTMIWRWESATNTYTKAKAPATLRGYEDLPSDLPELDFLFSDKDTWADFPNKGGITLAAPEKVDGVPVDVLAIKFNAPDASFSMDLHMMFGQKDHLLRRFVAGGNGKDEATGQPETLHVEYIYDLVDPTPHFTPTDFTFIPPPGAKLVGAPMPARKPATHGMAGAKK